MWNSGRLLENLFLQQRRNLAQQNIDLLNAKTAEILTIGTCILFVLEHQVDQTLQMYIHVQQLQRGSRGCTPPPSFCQPTPPHLPIPQKWKYVLAQPRVHRPNCRSNIEPKFASECTISHRKILILFPREYPRPPLHCIRLYTPPPFSLAPPCIPLPAPLNCNI